jgi:hypothetical protein
VFFQNGMLDPWFKIKGLVGANQVLAYFAVSKVGEPPVDGITDTNPEGLTAAFGSWAPAVAARLQNGGLTCKVRLCAFDSEVLFSVHPYIPMLAIFIFHITFHSKVQTT